jgi:hypothetical protein
VKGAPRELYANVILTAGPEGKDSLVVIQMCYAGPKEKGQEFLNAVSYWNGESSLLNEVDEKVFCISKIALPKFYAERVRLVSLRQSGSRFGGLCIVKNPCSHWKPMVYSFGNDHVVARHYQ